MQITAGVRAGGSHLACRAVSLVRVCARGWRRKTTAHGVDWFRMD